MKFKILEFKFEAILKYKILICKEFEIQTEF